MGLLQTAEYKKLGLQRCTICDCSVPLIYKSQMLTVYKIHNLSILLPESCRCFNYNIPNDFIAIPTNGLYITYSGLNEILSCQLSAGHYCEKISHSTPLITLITVVTTYYKMMMKKSDCSVLYQ